MSRNAAGTEGQEKAAGEAIVLPEDAEHRLGETVRLLRQRAGLSIQDLAQRTGLSTGMISQLERALASPSIRSLRLLSVALSVPISYFFEPHAPDPSSEYIVRRNDRRLLRLTASGVLKESLTPAQGGALEIYELTLNPGASSGADFFQHVGEKAVYVLSGRIRIWLDHEPHMLNEGDSVCFPSTLPHMFDNPEQAVARVIWVTTLHSGAPARDG